MRFLWYFYLCRLCARVSAEQRPRVIGVRVCVHAWPHLRLCALVAVHSLYLCHCFCGTSLSLSVHPSPGYARIINGAEINAISRQSLEPTANVAHCGNVTEEAGECSKRIVSYSGACVYFLSEKFALQTFQSTTKTKLKYLSRYHRSKYPDAQRDTRIVEAHAPTSAAPIVLLSAITLTRCRYRFGFLSIILIMTRANRNDFSFPQVPPICRPICRSSHKHQSAAFARCSALVPF